MAQVKIDIKRTGFPVKIGEIECWFDSSMENLMRFLKMDEIANKKMREALAKVENVKLPDDIDDIQKLMESIDDEMIDTAFDANKEYIAIQYDIIFGADTFDKLYKKYPDIRALEEALLPISNSIAKRIEESVDETVKKALEKRQAKQSSK